MRKLLFLGCFIASCSIANASPLYHEAESDAEKALKALFMNLDDWEAGKTLETTPKDFFNRYTKDFISSVNSQNCPPDATTECEPCVHPVICCMNDNFPNVYFFQTSSDDDAKAVIKYSANPEGPAGMEYRMLKDIDAWKLDGINCGGNGFNFQ